MDFQETKQQQIKDLHLSLARTISCIYHHILHLKWALKLF